MKPTALGILRSDVSFDCLRSWGAQQTTGTPSAPDHRPAYHLNEFPPQHVTPVSNFADRRHVALFGFLGQLFCDPAQSKGITPKLDPERVIEGFFPIYAADRSSHRFSPPGDFLSFS
jgi:hypothetical protein